MRHKQGIVAALAISLLALANPAAASGEAVPAAAVTVDLRTAQTQAIDQTISRKIAENWTRPRDARPDMVMDVRIRFSPEGVIEEATVAKSSGNSSFDNAALQAVVAIGRVEAIRPLDRQTYEQLYRERTLSFSVQPAAQ